MARSRGGQFDTVFDDLLKVFSKTPPELTFFRFLSILGPNGGPFGAHFGCNERSCVTFLHTVGPKGPPEAPRTPQSPTPDVDFGMIWKDVGGILA